MDRKELLELAEWHRQQAIELANDARLTISADYRHTAIQRAADHFATEAALRNAAGVAIDTAIVVNSTGNLPPLPRKGKAK